jgi:ring-1,2-phenylacetyl-CoA epoxidase subunit PaaD
VVTVTPPTRTAILELLGDVVDPEIPVLTIADLGILRDVVADEEGITVTITPTYSGCPAMDVIREEITGVLAAAGHHAVTVETVFFPAWTTEWMTDAAREKLRSVGIAPPGPPGRIADVVCPQCSAAEPRLVSEFGSTACKALLVCSVCGEPFDHFKGI